MLALAQPATSPRIACATFCSAWRKPALRSEMRETMSTWCATALALRRLA
jgi:hypothetical protein